MRLLHDAAEHYKLAPGKPEEKHAKVRRSYRRLQDAMGSSMNGEAECMQRILENRRLRLLQLAGMDKETDGAAIQRNLVRQRIHMLRTSNRNKIARYPDMDESWEEHLLYAERSGNGTWNARAHDNDE